MQQRQTRSRLMLLLWNMLFLLLLLLVGMAFLKNHRHFSSLPLFQIPPHEPSLAEQEPLYLDEVVDPSGTYPMAHVASMTELPDGKLAATWYAGSAELAADVNIYFSTKAQAATAWSEPVVIMTRTQAAKELGCYIKGLGNAILFAREDGILHLIYVTIACGKWSGSSLNLTSSANGGLTWEKSKRLFLSPFFNFSELVKNAPLPLIRGGWVIPIYQEFLGKFPELLWLYPEKNNSWVVTKSRIAGGCSFFQPSLTALSDKQAIAFCRDYHASEKVWSTQTEDGGQTWSLPQPTGLPNHDSGVASIRLSNGSLLLAFNDSTNSRDTLKLAISPDQGNTWSSIATIITEPHGDFCYPYFFRSSDGLLHLLYSWQRSHIHHVVFNEAWITQQASVHNMQSR